MIPVLVLAALGFLLVFGLAGRGGLRWMRRRKRRAMLSQRTAEREEGYREGMDLPEVFAEHRAAVTESRRLALEEWLAELGMKYDPDREYNIPAIQFNVGQRRADMQVQRLDRARQMLLSCMDGFERRTTAEKAQRDRLAAEIEMYRTADAARLANECSVRLTIAANLERDHADVIGVSALVAQLRQSIDRPATVEDQETALCDLLRQGPDPDGDYARVRKWAENTHGKGWQPCPKACGHFALDHLEAGGCIYPSVVSGEVVGRTNNGTDDRPACGCGEKGVADIVRATPIPTAKPTGKRRRQVAR